MGSLIQIDPQMGDLHSGRSVAKLTFQRGYLIYKPQAYTQHRLLKMVLDWLNHRTTRPIDYVIPQTVVVGAHAWVAFITSEPLDPSQTDQFFYECGVYLAIFHVLGSNDMHLENLLVQDQHPVLIDLETLCAYKQDQNVKSLNYSVLSAGWIPTSTTKAMDLNLSALFRRPEQTSLFIAQPVLAFDEQQGFHYIKASLKLTSNTANRKQELLLYGDEEGLAQLLAGFVGSIRIIQQHRANFKQAVQALFQEQPLRFRALVRSTQVYGEFLDGVRNPNTRYHQQQGKILQMLKRPQGRLKKSF
ncbi:DUF4135 domain-containing protein [Lacticaseibacillus casei]|nr:DUF4135 domain-containing protein [Lacticaseibacillus casei]MBI6596606.1 type 2 lantipeptide synthetase LanM [Lacticaseibacillus casei]MBO1480297.1 type 2 lantipeptide synthetase LanM [Lacticaseibacillus casei]MBO2415470.1 type 2 lantipeptide synthetase LanM [Lacticaseibacillus casei]MCK2079935.1 type 2 lantipeptide synthetase LanM [Lacticaseibacillus casei]MED7629488.1 DUF4135 domain-containing protein [Lacticaseibacillus casei]